MKHLKTSLIAVFAMAPCGTQSHHSLLYLSSLTHGLPGSIQTMGCVPPPAASRNTFPGKMPELGMDSMVRTQMPWVFRVLRRALRQFRVTLSKMAEHCGVVMEALCSAMVPTLAGKLSGMGSLEGKESVGARVGPGAGDRLGEKGRVGLEAFVWAPDMKSMDGEDRIDPDLKVWDLEELLASDEEMMDREEFLALDVKTVEEDMELLCLDDNLWEEDSAGGDQAELDLSDWLEWESGEEQSEIEEEEEECEDNCPSPEPQTPVLSLSARSCLHLTSEGEQGDSDSDWSDDDEDGDWDEGSDGNSELWESFLHTEDPYNPFTFSSSSSSSSSPPIGKKGKVEQDEGCRAASPLMAKGESKTCPPQTGNKAGKKVRFSDDVKVRPLVAWRFASREARDGSCWQEMARDRHRFQRRVQAASDVISPVLQPSHRASVWVRFQSA
ncbi:hypothetical protein AGOR_G00194150 [Albula goreensis]|uniref:Protein phosphatase 1 regulatory subunit 15A n=1 Tax=Albula goreensis TaxID=1534307 RepID=A0A8T3CTX0_9TELE|nr:hypothetical protein AGOR_G00194150 [Albula goreensis]